MDSEESIISLRMRLRGFTALLPFMTFLLYFPSFAHFIEDNKWERERRFITHRRLGLHQQARPWAEW